MIMELIHSFGAGIAFAVGVTFGAIAMQFTNRKSVEEWSKVSRNHFREVEDRLSNYVIHTARIADALDAYIKTRK